ncbi:MAG TPA: hypothetical protein VHP37_14925 [Burkholderiales bacterium]|nr:hypothetical protein [Burkholderiales bacterium]
MVNRVERQRLMQAHAAEQISVKTVVAICSACLLLLAGIAAMGSLSSSDASGARVVQTQR